MTTNQCLVFCFFAATALVTAAPSAPLVAPTGANSSESAAPATPALWIAVHLPKETRPVWVGDDMAERFADHLSHALHAQGFKGTVGTLRPEDSPTPRESVLEVSLIEWTARGGTGDCSFRAALRTPGGAQDLGLFSGDAMIVTGDGEHRISSAGLRDAARFAMNDLYTRITATNLISTR